MPIAKNNLSMPFLLLGENQEIIRKNIFFLFTLVAQVQRFPFFSGNVDGTYRFTFFEVTPIS